MQIYRVAIPSPLYRLFDYLPPLNNTQLISPGSRVKVPFGHGHRIGVVLEQTTNSNVAFAKLKPITNIIDDIPILSKELITLANWASQYYHHPIGEVISTLLPPALRKGKPATLAQSRTWSITSDGATIQLDTLNNAVQQKHIIELLQQQLTGLSQEQLKNKCSANWRSVIKALEKKGWVQSTQTLNAALVAERGTAPKLNDEQQQASDAIINSSKEFKIFALNGITGSGKTEVYLEAIEHTIQMQRQALVLVPEIGLTPQLLNRFKARFQAPMAILHSAISDKERLNTWLKAANGQAHIIIGTRSAIFTPLLSPGIIIIDEEHDLSYKQQDGFRYSARDIAVWRAQGANIPIVLGSATLSLETLYNVSKQRYVQLKLTQRAKTARSPCYHIVDIRNLRSSQLLSSEACAAIQLHLEAQGQVLVFLNRRGYAPVLLCHQCGWNAVCTRCEKPMTLHQKSARLRCHHCGAEHRINPSCPSCNSKELKPIGSGTEKIDETLQQQFPNTDVIRIDRDTTRRKGAMEKLLNQAGTGNKSILVGTQMLAKGHDFPNITLVVVLDADYGFFSPDFRASERLAQLIIQVSGRTGRAERPGEIIIQTHHPEHPLLKTLVEKGYLAFAQTELKERQEASLPPYSFIALLRAEALRYEHVEAFLQQAKILFQQQANKSTDILGPVPAPMPKRAGHYRGQLLVQSPNRKNLQTLLRTCIAVLAENKAARKVRWSIDVDAQEIY